MSDKQRKLAAGRVLNDMPPRSNRRQRVRERSRQAVARRADNLPITHRYQVTTPQRTLLVSSDTLLEARIDARELAANRRERVYIFGNSRDNRILRLVETVQPTYPILTWIWDRDEMPEKVNWQKEGF